MRLKSILLLDDDSISNLICETLCKKLDFSEKIYIYENAEEALAFLKTCESFPDLLILDLYMPVLEGVDFIELLKESRKDFSGKLFILTAVIQDRELKRAWKAGINELIMKPLSLNEFRKALINNFPGIELKQIGSHTG